MSDYHRGNCWNVAATLRVTDQNVEGGSRIAHLHAPPVHKCPAAVVMTHSCRNFAMVGDSNYCCSGRCSGNCLGNGWRGETPEGTFLAGTDGLTL